MKVFDQGGETSGADQIEIEESLEIETEKIDFQFFQPQIGFQQRLQRQIEEHGEQTQRQRQQVQEQRRQTESETLAPKLEQQRSGRLGQTGR